VKRWAGANHIDAEPLTAADTATMKSIYGGSWSWNRRAILVKYNGHVYAASMNGMPHGTTTISSNNFNGHFCIHFYNSRTHETNRVDANHQNAVARAMNAAVDKIIASCRGRGVVIDAIKLIESGLGEKCDLTVGLTAPEEVRLKRIMQRDGIDEAYAKKRIAAQKKDSFYKKHCMFLLENRAGSQKQFQQLIREFFSDMIEDMEG
jgi:hypothetical protein